ncbi:MAG: hypothetical protein WA208_13980 [Thermoanaerobaculia bacterium]
MADLPETTSWTYESVRIDPVGIHPLEGGLPSIRWAEVRRVALGFEIHPFVTADFYFWAFQLGDPHTMVRVVTTREDELSAEVRRRYGAPDIPPIRKWPDVGRDVVTWVIWPAGDLGKSLYTRRKKHWWSWSSKTYHALP